MASEFEPRGVVVKLEAGTSSAIRKSQVVTKISDVVRELVDNSVDAGTSSIQLILNNFGLDKIEVRDTGHGIAPTDLKKVVAGGYTSKLENVQHLSSGKSYGFRGEALASICSVANVSIVTKTIDEPQATKYILDRESTVLTEKKVAGGKGTAVTVEKIFSNYPVRRQWIQGKIKCANELKEIEAYLKAIAIANAQIHVSFYHNGSLIWSKASVPNIEQALITVLGHKLAKNLVKCGPFNVEVEEQEKRRRILEVFLLKKPVDMKTMSFTSNKLTIILVNRKRVFVREFEKLIQRYVAAIVERPAPADQRRFPVAVLNIEVPFDEVDFNRDMDKSKLFLIHKEELAKKLEEVLITFYGVDLLSPVITVEKLTEEFNDGTENCTTPNINLQDNPNQITIEENISEIPVCPILNSLDFESQSRDQSIKGFLDIPSASSSNFALSPVKNIPVNPIFPKYKPPADKIVGLENTNQEMRFLNQPVRENCVSNFDLNLDGWSYTQTQEESKEISKDKEEFRLKQTDWVHGRMTDASGALIKNVAVINRPPTRESCEDSQFRNNQRTPFNQYATPPTPMPSLTSSSSASKIGSGFRLTSPKENEYSQAKRPRLSEPRQTNGNGIGVSFSSVRQISLNECKNWQNSGNLRTPLAMNTPNVPTGVRLATPVRISKQTKPGENTIGMLPKSVKDSWNKSSFHKTNNGLMGLQRNVNLENTLKNLSPNSSQGPSRSKLIGGITGTEYHAAQVHEFVGAFSPMAMLHLHPMLKYDLNLSFEKLNLSSPETPNSQYSLTKDSVAKLFNHFSTEVDPSSKAFSKIFHILQDLKTPGTGSLNGFC